MARTKPRTPEKAVLRACLEYLALQGIEAWRNNTGAMRLESNGRARYVRFSKPGASDILGYLPDGRFLAVECKGTGGRPTEEQTRFLERVNRAGGVGLLVRSLDELIAGLEERRRA